MPSAEEDRLYAEIGRISGLINRERQQQAGITAIPSMPRDDNDSFRLPSADPRRVFSDGTTYRGNPYSRGYHRGSYRVGKYGPFRNRTLVLNGQQTPSDIESGATSDASTTSRITKSNSHIQLINTNHYNKNGKAMTKATEQRRNELMKTNQQEKTMLASHLRQMAANGATSTNGSSSGRHEIVVEGIRFYVTKNGSKLAKVPDDPAPPSATPKMATIGGVKFYRSKGGNLYRQGIVKAQRHLGNVRKRDQLCKIFSTTGTCYMGPHCRYLHDAHKVAACRDFLQKGECSKGDYCDLSHDLTPQRTPHCVHFAKGNCTNDKCRYTHSDGALATQLCRPFGYYGYCEAGAECTSRHVYGECPDFSNTGTCTDEYCKLQHRERASVLRNTDIREKANFIVDASSDEEDSVGDDDVDSDQVDEWIGQDDTPFLDFEQGKDFIELS